VKERVKERKNRMWEVKCREVDNMVEGLRSTEVWRFLKNLQNDSQYFGLYLITMSRHITTNLFLKIDRNSLKSISAERDLNQSIQIIIEKLKRRIKTTKNGRSSEPGRIIPELKCELEYLDRNLL
jgi:hypothetical protein